MDFKKTNSAVLKSMFMQMQKDVFIANAQLLKKEYLEFKPNFYNKNYEVKLWQLLKFCTIWYINFWKSKK
jgi:hypothetical protein